MRHSIYKVLAREEWQAAQRDGTFKGSAVDLADGYIHFSTAPQLRETVRRHFRGQPDLLLLSVDPGALPADALRWEPGRGGDLFPHLYAPMPLSAVRRSDELPLDGEQHRLPDHVPGS
jgi:uncharacterized protein (DUF952 family)